MRLLAGVVAFLLLSATSQVSAAGPRYEDFAFTANGGTVIAVGPDRYTLSGWDLAQPKVRKSIRLDREIDKVVLSPDSDEVVIDGWTAGEVRYFARIDLASMTIASDFEIIDLWDAPLKTPVLSRKAKTVSLLEELYRKPGRQIAFSTNSGKVKSERALPRNASEESWIGLDDTRALEVSPTGMRVFDTVKQQFTVSFKYGCETNEQQISVAANLVAVICRTWDVPIFSLETGKRLSKLKVSSSYPTSHFFNSDGSAFIDDGEFGDLYSVMDPRTGATVYTFPQPKGAGDVIAASSDKILFGKNFNRRLELYTLYTNTLIATLSTE